MVRLMMAMGVLCVAIATQAQSAEQQNGQISPELIGKWCYTNVAGGTSNVITNSCFTLNADGSFEASLDRSSLPGATALGEIPDTDSGKWWVSGNRFFYNSLANGQGSFTLQKLNHPRLENTPLILLNGIAFAATSSHDPW